MKCDNDQNCLSKKERKQKKEDKLKKKSKRLDQQNSTDVKQLCEDAAQNTSLEVVTERSTKKKHKRKKHDSDSVGDEIVSERKSGEHSLCGDGKIKRQKTEVIEQTTSNNCDSRAVEIKSKKKKSKKERAVSVDPAGDTNELSGQSQDITQSVTTKIKKHKKSKVKSADGEYEMQAKTASTVLEKSSGITHKNKSKKRKRMPLSTDEKNEDTKDTYSKENNSSLVEEESSKKKKKKHSKHKDCEPIDGTNSNISRKKHKNQSKSSSGIRGDDEVQANTDEHDSVEGQDSTKHVSSDVNISQAGDDKSSRHKKQKKHSKNSPAVGTDQNVNRKCEIIEFDKPTSDQIIKPEPSPDCASAALGNWQGNLFENNERQSKFLRLLGGMKKSNNSTTEISKASAAPTGTKKKGLFGSLATLSNTASSGSSAALDVDAAASLNQKLEDEYNRAMDFKLSGKVGTGFGFVRDPAEGKKFHIDVNKSKSVKFDD